MLINSSYCTVQYSTIIASYTLLTVASWDPGPEATDAIITEPSKRAMERYKSHASHGGKSLSWMAFSYAPFRGTPHIVYWDNSIDEQYVLYAVRSTLTYGCTHTLVSFAQSL